MRIEYVVLFFPLTPCAYSPRLCRATLNFAQPSVAFCGTRTSLLNRCGSRESRRLTSVRFPPRLLIFSSRADSPFLRSPPPPQPPRPRCYAKQILRYRVASHPYSGLPLSFPRFRFFAHHSLSCRTPSSSIPAVALAVRLSIKHPSGTAHAVVLVQSAASGSFPSFLSVGGY
jgi:hypothetical protein